MRTADFKSAIVIKPGKEDTTALEQISWLLDPFLLAAGLARVSRKEVKILTQHDLQRDLFAISVSFDGKETVVYDKKPRTVCDAVCSWLAEQHAKQIGAYRDAAQQKKKRASRKKSR